MSRRPPQGRVRECAAYEVTTLETASKASVAALDRLPQRLLAQAFGPAA